MTAGVRAGLGLVLLSLVLATGRAARAQDEPPPDDPEQVLAADEISLREEVRAIAARVEALRGLRFPGPVDVGRLPRDMQDVAAEVRVASALPPARLAARGRAWADLGLAAGDGPRALLTGLALDLPGISLDPDRTRLLLAPEVLPYDELTLKEEESAPATLLLAAGVRPDGPSVAHALTHLLERGQGERWPGGETTDAWLAAAASREGRATLLAVRYLFEAMDLDEEILALDLDLGALVDGRLLPAGVDDAPPVVRSLLRFVHEEGFARAAAAWRSRRSRAAAPADADRTTRDVLHPDLAGRPVAAPEAPPAPSGLVAADLDTLGEQGIITLVSVATGKDNLALLAGDGWAGDTLVRYEPAHGGDPAGGTTLWLARFVSAEEAADFEHAMRRVLGVADPAPPLDGAPPPGISVDRNARRTSMVRRAELVEVRISPVPVPSGG